MTTVAQGDGATVSFPTDPSVSGRDAAIVGSIAPRPELLAETAAEMINNALTVLNAAAVPIENPGRLATVATVVYRDQDMQVVRCLLEAAIARAEQEFASLRTARKNVELARAEVRRLSLARADRTTGTQHCPPLTSFVAPRGVPIPPKGFTWTEHTFTCTSCKRLTRASQEVIATLRRDENWEGKSDAEIAASLDFCVRCVDGEEHEGEHIEGGAR